MREIKFRAWNPETDTMFEVNEMDLYGSGKVMVHKWASSYTDNWPLMQFTGLRDKNGKEIWESDVLRWDINGKSYVGRVGYDNSFASFWLDTTCSGINDWARGQYEVLGNIFEHPHLLEKL